ncbi:hypothetical protein ES319_D10G042700v1 [Gossypium barbadense]|uniref:CASP-like protein n=1 Tax=Gossypium barbadense TaxID=3634 RepID=A0A5J5PNF1_GOSBA|nr:hypothetical protein ES319_D10G042700v1 [Gossypium barbadense]
MEGSKMAMILIAYITVLAVFTNGATALREDQGAVAPSPMESAGAALGVPAAVAALASMAACLLLFQATGIVDGDRNFYSSFQVIIMLIKS